jgi:hypothetical protein
VQQLELEQQQEPGLPQEQELEEKWEQLWVQLQDLP